MATQNGIHLILGITIGRDLADGGLRVVFERFDRASELEVRRAGTLVELESILCRVRDEIRTRWADLDRRDLARE